MVNDSWLTILSKAKDFEISKGITSFVNPYSMLLLKDLPDIANDVDNWCVDGISLVDSFNRIKIGKQVHRFSFDETSIAPNVFNFIKDRNLRVAIVGTKEEYIKKAVMVIESKYSIKVDYFRNGFFYTKEEMDNCIELILNRNFDVVICGMGTVNQEKFLIDLKKKGWTNFGFTCGGYLHQIAKREKYYPFLFDRLDVRWIYRIIDEPKLFKRYLFEYPKFFIQFRSFKKEYEF